MIVRKIRQEEYKRAQQFCSLAFEYQMKESEKPALEVLEQITKNPQSRQDLYWDSQWAAFADDDQTMLSTFTVIPYHANFDGHSMLMMGIGGVATLPQYRRCGGIRHCFEKALPDMYLQGAAFSYLYPFSTSFYRKFGYELGCERSRWKLKLAGMPKTAPEGTCHLLEPGTDLKQDIRRVYEVWQKRYNLMTIDEEIEYAWIDKADPFRDIEYTYLYRSNSGEPKGFMTYKPVIDEGDRTLNCTRFFFVDLEGFYGMLALLGTLSADHSHVTLRLPADIELGGLLPEWSFGTVIETREQAGMVRVVNVEHALSMARMRGTGSLSIDITDAHIPQNNGRFSVAFSDGVTTEVRRTQEPADIALTIQDFSRLICGRYDLTALPYLPQVKQMCDTEKAAKVFYKKPMFITRYF